MQARACAGVRSLVRYGAGSSAAWSRRCAPLARAQGARGFALASFEDSYDLYINGKWTPSSNGQYLEVEDPATGQPLTRVAAGQAADVDAAVRSGAQAFGAGDVSRAAAPRRRPPRRPSAC